MNKFSFEGIGAVAATFGAESGVKGGRVVKLTGANTVGPCADGDKFCGLAMEPRRGGAAVQVKGFCTVPCTGSLVPGWAQLVADGQGGVRAAAGAESGVSALVVSAGTDSTVICL